jgi:hypothetical protein
MVFELSFQSMPLALQTKCNGIRIVISVDAACFRNGVARKKFFRAQLASTKNFFRDRTPVITLLMRQKIYAKDYLDWIPRTSRGMTVLIPDQVRSGMAVWVGC